MATSSRISFRGPLQRILGNSKRHLPSLNFITLHYAYFIGTCLVISVIFWGSSTPPRSVTFVDSIFLVVSGMTLAGLNTVNLSTLNTFQQFILFTMILAGSAIFVSAFVVRFRLRAFEKRFKVIRDQRANGMNGAETNNDGSLTSTRPDHVEKDRSVHGPHFFTNDRPTSRHTIAAAMPDAHKAGLLPELSTKGDTFDHLTTVNSIDLDHGRRVRDGHISFHSESIFRLPSPVHSESHTRHVFNVQAVGARPALSRHRISNSRTNQTDVSMREMSDFTFQRPASARHNAGNSQFHDLSSSEREELGGEEYKAVKLLGVLVPLYFVLFNALGCLALGAYVMHNRPEPAIQNGLNPFWVGAFNAVSAFNNSGMSLLDANMVAFQTSTYMLLTMGFLILAGHTCYPVFLRLIIWTIRSILPDNQRWAGRRKTLKFLLDHPRRCYTNLFPARHTWWLLAAVMCLNGIDWIGFEVLNIGNDAITKLPNNVQVLGGLFQAIAVRHGGFYVVPMPSVRISLQFLYVIMMYISVYPVVITIRNSNVYEERSLAIYADDPQEPDSGSLSPLKDENQTEMLYKSYFIRQQLRAQLSHDLWLLALAVFLVLIVEADKFERDPATFSVFNVIFETVSGYGCVGISIGAPDNSYSFSGSWRPLSKLILCAVMLRGRHRGLPVAIDKAVLLPGEDINRAGEEAAHDRIERSGSRGGAA